MSSVNSLSSIIGDLRRVRDNDLESVNESKWVDQVPGQSATNSEDESIPNSIAISKYSYAVRSPGNVKIYEYNPVTLKLHVTELSGHSIKILKNFL